MMVQLNALSGPTVRERMVHQEQALIALLDRIAVLERSLAFEVQQREALEQIILRLTTLPLRMDHLERDARHRRLAGDSK